MSLDRRTVSTRDNLGRHFGSFVSLAIQRVVVCVLCALLLEATSSTLLPTKFRHRSSNSADLRLAIPQASASAMPSSSSSESSFLAHGLIPCMIAINNDITRCNETYQKSLTNIITRGYRKESNRYKRQYCCGWTSRHRCVTESVKSKCHPQTIEQIQSDQNKYSLELELRQISSIDCHNLTKNFPCSGAASHFAFPLMAVSALMHWLGLTYIRCIL